MDGSTLKLLRCQQCSAALGHAAGSPLLKCAFCGSTYLVEQPQKGPAGLPVRFLPFSISPADARRKLSEWLGEGLFRPGDLDAESVVELQEPVHVPVYLARCRAHSNWTAEIVHTDVRKVKIRPRIPVPSPDPGDLGVKIETRTDRQALSGAHDAEYPNVHALASRGLSQELFWSLADHDWSRLEPIPPDDPSAGPFEEPIVTRDEATQTIRTRVEELERTACKGMVPGSHVADLRVNTVVDVLDLTLAYAPVYTVSYRYEGRAYRACINGVTGTAAGDRPVSVARVTLAAAVLVVVPAVLLWLFRKRW